ncbi:MAG: hypothetical protein J3Q66DRAFT_355763 [Benniella sp.]|nr:MAG: hypothetical protein J3Q66DRAFT_355763 [Benniella sp.]
MRAHIAHREPHFDNVIPSDWIAGSGQLCQRRTKDPKVADNASTFFKSRCTIWTLTWLRTNSHDDVLERHPSSVADFKLFCTRETGCPDERHRATKCRNTTPISSMLTHEMAALRDPDQARSIPHENLSQHQGSSSEYNDPEHPPLIGQKARDRKQAGTRRLYA